MTIVTSSVFLDKYNRFLQTTSNNKAGSVFLSFKRYQLKEEKDDKEDKDDTAVTTQTTTPVCLAHVKLGNKNFSCVIPASEVQSFTIQFNGIYSIYLTSLVPAGGESERLKKRREASKLHTPSTASNDKTNTKASTKK